MNIIITGSNGFIGGNVCRWFHEREEFMIGIGRHKQSLTNVDEYICCNLASDDCLDILRSRINKKIDAVIHLAADLRMEPYERQVLYSNCVGTQQVLEYCYQTKVPVFVQLSSLPLIGKPVQNPITEEHPLNPPTVYHISKKTQEFLADYVYYTHNLRTVSFRISTPIGIGGDSKRILPLFVHNAIKGKDLILYGKGTQKQNYIHVDDISQAIYKAIYSKAHGVFNLRSNNVYSNYEIAQQCIQITKSSSKIVYSNREDPMDDCVWNVSLDKIKKHIGYEPRVSIESMIDEIYRYILRNGEYV